MRDSVLTEKLINVRGGEKFYTFYSDIDTFHVHRFICCSYLTVDDRYYANSWFSWCIFISLGPSDKI